MAGGGGVMLLSNTGSSLSLGASLTPHKDGTCLWCSLTGELIARVTNFTTIFPSVPLFLFSLPFFLFPHFWRASCHSPGSENTLGDLVIGHAASKPRGTVNTQTGKTGQRCDKIIICPANTRWRKSMSQWTGGKMATKRSFLSPNHKEDLSDE